MQIPPAWNGFAYVCDGSGRICGTQANREHALVFGPGDHVTASTNDEAGLRFLLIAGKPIEEPVVQYGPFVMNTQVTSVQNLHPSWTDDLHLLNGRIWLFKSKAGTCHFVSNFHSCDGTHRRAACSMA